MPNDYELIAEMGWISDRDFLEQYLENEWDREVDHRTGLRLRKYWNNHLFDLSAQAQVNDFFTVTEQLPWLDHYMLGGSLLGDHLTWSAHNQVGYERLNVADAEESDRSGIVFTDSRLEKRVGCRRVDTTRARAAGSPSARLKSCRTFPVRPLTTVKRPTAIR